MAIRVGQRDVNKEAKKSFKKHLSTRKNVIWESFIGVKVWGKIRNESRG